MCSAQLFSFLCIQSVISVHRFWFDLLHSVDEKYLVPLKTDHPEFDLLKYDRIPKRCTRAIRHSVEPIHKMVISWTE